MTTVICTVCEKDIHITKEVEERLSEPVYLIPFICNDCIKDYKGDSSDKKSS